MPALTHLDVVTALDYNVAREIITSFISNYVSEAGARGAVVGLSGGVDSTVTAALAVEALGRDRVLAVFAPHGAVPSEDERDAVAVARQLDVSLRRVDLAPALESLAACIPDFSREDRVAAGNLAVRVRMAVLYYYANKYGMLVLGTSDRSELLLGYFTKYGDGAADVMPIAGLYKVQVREMARRLGFERIAGKPSSPRLWPGHTAEAELGAPYEIIDPILFTLYDAGVPPEIVMREYGPVADLVLARARANAHKLRPPPHPDLTPARRPITPARSTSVQL
jgi:NAD+ synthase